MRWRHPRRGFLLPDAFLTAAEQGGLMRNLTRYVLDEALLQLRAWRSAGLESTSPSTCRHAISPTLASRTRWHKPSRTPSSRRGWSSRSPESVLLSDRLRTSRMLERLVDQGVRIAIDDFGVGGSSARPAEDPAGEVLKIDRSFVSSMESDQSDAAIVSSTIELAPPRPRGHRRGCRDAGSPGALACRRLRHRTGASPRPSAPG